MIKIRTTKTASGKTAVQVVNYSNQKTIILKHLGSAKTEIEVKQLYLQGKQFIESKLGISPLFPELSSLHRRQVVSQLMDSVAIRPTRHLTVYQLLSDWYRHCGFDQLSCELLKDLVIIRLIEPTSKQRSVLLLRRHFLRKYSLTKVYRQLQTFKQYKKQAESCAIAFAKLHYGFAFSLVFYDVTTLYFESFTPDELRKCGFSKDNKSNQPQIIVGLVVDQQGFPISYAVFEGNTFEGHTMIPIILDLKKQHGIETLTVVADAAMLSQANMDELTNHKLSYIVGARIGNLSQKIIQEISTSLNKNEHQYFTMTTSRGKLICDYSKSRAAKDKSDCNKQLARAKIQVGHPEQVVRKSKFVKAITKTKLILNQDLITKAESLEGIKGYYTNLDNVDESLIVKRYHDLWHVEKSFRIAKSDLLARPIFHFKKESIESHLLIVFISLCLTKSLELTTNMSIKRIKDLLWQIEDIEFEDLQTHDIYHKQTSFESPELDTVLQKIKVTY